ncbi:hypothetical protein TPR58_07115 [Sphingomonas sp. HF-S3]|uniref:Peptidase M1 membrane alanine aminopeptidase domain-containing protein n=1 Tax=Sphingomonas rustica TaxID=3103142 RepID=A0ABV0B880_9SPHN
MILAALLLAGTPAGQTSDPARCEAIREAIPPTQRCMPTPGGIVIAGSAERAAQLSRIATSGEGRFEQRFGRKVPAYAVVETGDGTQNAALDAILERRGYVSRLPWLSPEAMANAYRASITRAVTAQAASRNLTAAQTSALIESALAQQSAKWDPATLAELETGTLPHELGHGWFIKAFWPTSAPKAGDHYGGPAPDWMDETAAVLMESDALAEKRRRQFATIYSGSDAAARASLLDLGTFLSGGHPALPKLDPSTSGGSVNVLTGDEAARIAKAAGSFYLQARLFADYVLDRSGDPAAFRSAADAFAAGKDSAGWLAASGPRLRLPSDIPALQKDWEQWLALHLAPRKD